MPQIFRYFRSPRSFAPFVSEPRECTLCHITKLGYNGPYFGREELDFACEDCIANGSLVAAGFSTNEGDEPSVRGGLTIANREQSLDFIRAEAARRTLVLAAHTPHASTWQPFAWPVHCSDYCCYLKEAGQVDILGLSSNDSVAFLATHLGVGYSIGSASDLWHMMRPDSPNDLSEPWSTSFYLFQCLDCSDHVVLWDSD